MARELNPELFASREVREIQNGGNVPAQVTYAKADEVRVLHMHVDSLSRRMKEFESRVETMHTKVEELTTSNRGRFERIQNHFRSSGEAMANALLDMNGKIAHVVSRVNERKLSENMIKEMVERHTNVVQAFEVRVNQMQKLMSEQEMQLMHARSELKQALQELSRLKKF